MDWDKLQVLLALDNGRVGEGMKNPKKVCQRTGQDWRQPSRAGDSNNEDPTYANEDVIFDTGEEDTDMAEGSSMNFCLRLHSCIRFSLTIFVCYFHWQIRNLPALKCRPGRHTSLYSWIGPQGQSDKKIVCQQTLVAIYIPRPSSESPRRDASN